MSCSGTESHGAALNTRKVKLHIEQGCLCCYLVAQGSFITWGGYEEEGRERGVVACSQSAYCNNQQLRASLKAIIAPDVQHFSMNTGLQGNKVLAFK